MNGEGNTRDSKRYVALDIHKHYCVVAAVDREGKVVLQPVRVEHQDLEGWLKKNLRASDHVVIESTTNAWHVYDLLSPLVERVVVANSFKVKQIANARFRQPVKLFVHGNPVDLLDRLMHEQPEEDDRRTRGREVVVAEDAPCPADDGIGVNMRGIFQAEIRHQPIA